MKEKEIKNLDNKCLTLFQIKNNPQYKRMFWWTINITM